MSDDKIRVAVIGDATLPLEVLDALGGMFEVDDLDMIEISPPHDLVDIPAEAILPKQPQGRSRGKGKYRKPWEM